MTHVATEALESRDTITLFVPRESHLGEPRVAAVPDSVRALVADGFRVVVEAGAGLAADYPDAAYEAAGAQLGSAADAARAQVWLSVGAPEASRLQSLAA